MLDAVLLVLREVLEAALFVSLLLALGARLGLRARWERVAIPLGLLASWTLSHFAGAVAESFDGIGQELLNGSLYAMAIGCFIVLNASIVPMLFGRQRGVAIPPGLLLGCFVLIVACSIAREGSEVWIYLSSYVGAPDAMSAAITGGLIGTGIGLSLCALVFYALSFLGRRACLVAFLVLTTLVIGGLSMQLAKLGSQIGWLDSGAPIWDMTWLVSERSWFGQLLHALFGYDANPDAVQAAFYFGALLIAMLAALARAALTRVQRDA
jgi:high-affinity iron transporter